MEQPQLGASPREVRGVDRQGQCSRRSSPLLAKSSQSVMRKLLTWRAGAVHGRARLALQAQPGRAGRTVCTCWHPSQARLQAQKPLAQPGSRQTPKAEADPDPHSRVQPAFSRQADDDAGSPTSSSMAVYRWMGGTRVWRYRKRMRGMQTTEAMITPGAMLMMKSTKPM